MVEDSEKWKDDSGKSVATWIRNRMLRLRVRKIEQWGALSVARTEHPSLLNRIFDILVLTIGQSMNVTREGVVCGLKLF